jgi:hypothetical protein
MSLAAIAVMAGPPRAWEIKAERLKSLVFNSEAVSHPFAWFVGFAQIRCIAASTGYLGRRDLH